MKTTVNQQIYQPEGTPDDFQYDLEFEARQAEEDRFEHIHNAEAFTDYPDGSF